MDKQSQPSHLGRGTQAALLLSAVKVGSADPLEKELATHSSVLAWEIPWTEEPGELQSLGSQRVRQQPSNQTAITKKSFDGLEKCR